MTIPFGRKFAESDKFTAVFQEGMALVERTAAYLDGQGRIEAKALGAKASLAYATESMRLTTRLMQLASWLLIRRAVNEGELTERQAFEDKHKVRLEAAAQIARGEGYDGLPETLKELIEASLTLHRRIVRLDGLLYAEMLRKSPDNAHHPLSDQIARIAAAFGHDQARETGKAS